MVWADEPFHGTVTDVPSGAITDNAAAPGISEIFD